MEQTQEREIRMYYRPMATLSNGLDHTGRTSLSAQIYGSIRDVIESGPSSTYRRAYHTNHTTARTSPLSVSLQEPIPMTRKA